MARVLVLDVDGTLMDTNYLHTEAWARAFDKVGYRVPRAEIHKQIGKGSDQLIEEFIQDEVAAGKANELHGDFYMDVQHHGYPLPGAKELIDGLAKNGQEVWLATSAKPEELELYIEQLQAEGKLAGIVNSSDVENSKPAPDIFGLALEKAGASSDETIAVGDSIWDILSAKAAGIRSIGVLTGGAYGREELKEAGANEVCDDCADLLESGFLDS